MIFRKNVLFLLLTATLSLFACKKDDAISPNTVNTTVVAGTWKITYYWDTDHEETTNYTNYAFTFGSNGVLTATKSGSTITGAWSTGTDDSKVKLILIFTSPSNFAEISDDWHVIEKTDTKIRLQDVSGGNGGTDYLTFEKM